MARNYTVEDVEAMQAETEAASAGAEETEENAQQPAGMQTVTDEDGNVVFTQKAESEEDPTKEA